MNEVKYIKQVVVDLTAQTNQVDQEQVINKKRAVTELGSWQFSQPDLCAENQLSYITQLHTSHITSTQPCKVILQHISQKLNGYRSQDVKKGLYDKLRFVDIQYAVELLKKSSNTCYYCREPVHVLYENVREPKQWSLDRLFNDQGHNKGNLVIACLKCNVTRKTMYHERYAFTKQLVIVKQN